MQFKLNQLQPLKLSLILHGALSFGVGLLFILNPKVEYTDIVELDVVEIEKKPPQSIRLTKPKPVQPKPKSKPRAVFGQSRKALVTKDPELSQDLVETKKGNTITKEIDDKKLKETDPDSLPIPTDEYLVSQMPVLINEFRIPYPDEARKKGIEGPVVMDLLIDRAGVIRKAELVQGPGSGLNQAALNAIKNFRFKPARVEDRPVAVKIRYVYRFILER